MGRRRSGIALGVLLALVIAPSARGQVDQTCELSLTKFDPAVVNVAYPDQAATYYSGTYQTVPGTRIRITGRYPHARYMSFNVYDNLQRPLDALADVEIAPDRGSTNPFVLHADRTTKKRDYTAFIDFGKIPSKRARNTLYASKGQEGEPNLDGTFIYRVYVPDRGLDELGGVGVPTVTLESTTSGQKPSSSACSNFSRPSPPGVNELIASQNGLPVAGPAPGTNPPHWRKFINLPRSFVETVLDNPFGDPARRSYESSPLYDVGGSGGFLSNIHNAYLYAPIAKLNGPILVTRLRAPTFPNTRPAPPRMPGGQLRYFSMCQNESQSQRFIACSTDDQTTINSDHYMNYVVSTPAERPANARPECGMTWIPWGPQAGGVLIYRNMLPNSSFAQAIQRVPAQGLEQHVMGVYFPISKYYADRASFEQLGCAEARTSSPVATATCADRTPPFSTISHTGRVHFDGRASDFGCSGGPNLRSRAGGVKTVYLIVFKRTKDGRCRFVQADGQVGSASSCSHPVLLGTDVNPSNGQAKVGWSRDLPRSLPAGRYDAAVRALDIAGNREPNRGDRTEVDFVVR